jgi:serine/threonine-protein kinase RsbW
MRVRLQVTLQLPRDAATVGKVRRVLTGAMAALGVLDGDADDIRLIITEACTNVIKHADEVDGYTVSVELSATRCVLEVTNIGEPVDPRLWSVALPGGSPAEYGRGLQIIEAIADTVTVLPGELGGVTIRAVKALRWSPGTMLS